MLTSEELNKIISVGRMCDCREVTILLVDCIEDLQKQIVELERRLDADADNSWLEDD